MAISDELEQTRLAAALARAQDACNGLGANGIACLRAGCKCNPQ